MGKKSRKRGKFKKFRVQSVPSPLAARADVQLSAPQTAVLPKQTSSTKPLTTATDLTTRYQYVVPEAVRIAIIAGAMFLIIVILSFFLR